MFASMYLGVNERGEFFPLRAMFVPMGGFVLKKLASGIEVIQQLWAIFSVHLIVLKVFDNLMKGSIAMSYICFITHQQMAQYKSKYAFHYSGEDFDYLLREFIRGHSHSEK
jgi:hypothetical protein